MKFNNELTPLNLLQNTDQLKGEDLLASLNLSETQRKQLEKLNLSELDLASLDRLTLLEKLTELETSDPKKLLDLESPELNLAETELNNKLLLEKQSQKKISNELLDESLLHNK